MMVSVQQEPCAGSVKQDPVSSWESSNEFRMYHFKITMCSKRYNHDYSGCPYLHMGERAGRRDPRTHNYTSVTCIDVLQKGKCPRGAACTAAHSVFEFWLHPHRYRTEMCKVGHGCTRRICFFAHDPSELRPLPPHLAITADGSHSTGGKYSLSAALPAAAVAKGGSNGSTGAASGGGSSSLSKLLRTQHGAAATSSSSSMMQLQESACGAVQVLSMPPEHAARAYSSGSSCSTSTAAGSHVLHSSGASSNNNSPLHLSGWLLQQQQQQQGLQLSGQYSSVLHAGSMSPTAVGGQEPGLHAAAPAAPAAAPFTAGMQTMHLSPASAAGPLSAAAGIAASAAPGQQQQQQLLLLPPRGPTMLSGTGANQAAAVAAAAGAGAGAASTGATVSWGLTSLSVLDPVPAPVAAGVSLQQQWMLMNSATTAGMNMQQQQGQEQGQGQPVALNLQLQQLSLTDPAAQLAVTTGLITSFGLSAAGLSQQQPQPQLQLPPPQQRQHHPQAMQASLHAAAAAAVGASPQAGGLQQHAAPAVMVDALSLQQPLAYAAVTQAAVNVSLHLQQQQQQQLPYLQAGQMLAPTTQSPWLL